MAKRESWMLDSIGDCLFGQIGMVVIWYWCDEEEESALRGIELLPALLDGDTEDFTTYEWFIFQDALGSYPLRTPIMEEINVLATEGRDGRLPAGPTKKFRLLDE